MALKVVALAGGVGGAKLADGLAQILPASDLTIVVNTGDDFRYMGLAICPDLDTVCYTLAGMENSQTGWGRRDETWNVQASLSALTNSNWFQLGDRDLATHLLRTDLIGQGKPLSEITKMLCQNWGVACQVLPMTDQMVQTKIETDKSEQLDFQEYFVHQKWQPVVRKVHFSGSTSAQPAHGVLEAIRSADVVVLCPSNPLVSIDPILSIPGIKGAVMTKPVIGVSPIVGGAAVKGPLAKMIQEMFQVDPSSDWVAAYYQQQIRLDAFVIDEVDSGYVPAMHRQGIICSAVPSIMKTRDERLRLAETVLMHCQHLCYRGKQ